MTTTALVPVFAGTLAGQPQQLCNARDLHGNRCGLVTDAAKRDAAHKLQNIQARTGYP